MCAPGEPEVDYPIMASTQETSFTCEGLIFGGYYADQEARCQQYHVCLQVPPSVQTMITWDRAICESVMKLKIWHFWPLDL